MTTTSRRTAKKPVSDRRMKRTALDPGRCPQCGERTLRGWTNGLDYALDSDPLTPYGEVAALISKRRTFEVIDPVRWKLRTTKLIEKPWPEIATVHREHRCDTGPVPYEHRRPVTGSAAARPKPPPFPDSPPY